ncbi:unnamed protein product [Plutella xylostella]|uniref:DNA polymerase zeta catalytic subunit n=1 Tax=Plutella xylostella TaxID=51655 RepID=A0A8S4G6G6_PLUXY|nr:unnamed protein product [Plutella xylostella]
MSSTLGYSSQSKPAFSVRIFVCDHYSTKPVPGVDVIYSEFRGSDIKQVPVLRIFGSAPDGHKACLHVHGVFPYFYVPCPDPNPQPQFLYQMAASLDKALNIALKQATSANQHVYKISLVKGLPFYGFHDKDHLFLKIFLYNPGLIKQAVDLCANGAILGQPFQPYEAHLNFTMQFFIDFNLFGMSNVDLQSVSFRKKPGNSQNSTDPLNSLEDSMLKSESMCFYEADCAASHIINRQRMDKGDGIENPGLKEIWQQEEERRKQLNISEASKSLSQGRIKAELTDSHYKFDQIFKIKMCNLVNKPVEVDSKYINLDTSYPAVSLDETEVFKAVDVSMHLPDKTLEATMNETLTHHNETQDLDETLVDENIALNSSLSMHYSQIQLDSEDLDLLDVLKDMDEKTVEEDSVMGTPAAADDFNDNDSDDAEYSQVFNDDTVLLEQFTSKNDDVEETSPIWNDSFWEDANIPQLDGTFDDDHVKKVRKRKMRPFKLGLSRPKNKRKITVSTSEATSVGSSNADLSESDEIDASRETIDSISSLHLRKAIKTESKSVLEISELDQDSQFSNDSITDLVKKVTNKYESNINSSKEYDLKNNYESIAGPSKCNAKKTEDNSNCDNIESCNKSVESSPDDLGFISFYNTSKFFDVSLDDKSPLVKSENADEIIMLSDREVNNVERTLLSEEDIKLHYSDTPLVSNLNSINIKQESHVAIENKHHIILTPKFRPPTKKYIESSLEKYKIPSIRNLEPYYSNHKDVGDKVEIGQMIIKVQSKLSHDQKPLDKVLDTTSIEEWRQLMFLQNNEFEDENTKPNNLKTLLAGNRQCVLEPIKRPPTSKEINEWLKAKDSEKDLEVDNTNTSAQMDEVTNIIDDLETSQVIGLNELETSISLEIVEMDKTSLNESLQVTMQPDGSFLCFGSGQRENEVPEVATVEINHMTIMLIEVHTATRGEYKPDPLLDEIEAVFITITNDSATEHFPQKTLTKIIVVDDMSPPKKLDRCVFNQDISYVDSEKNIIESVLELTKVHDPDIMCGYETEMSSWGYILDRAEHLGWEIVQEVSRINEKHRQKRWRGEQNDYESRVIGRVLLNVWRLFRHELALSSYSFESCMYEILKERVPQYSHAQLSEWWRDESRVLRWVPVEYYLTRLSGTVRMLEKLDIINRTAELARVFGLQWLEVLTRGTQLRVESLMLRAARPLNLLPLSPTVRQRAAMTAPDCLPLIYEPESRFYSDPVIVLDFKSLYPSIMIAYNYCFSTCIGRVHNINGDAPYEFGAWRLRISKAKLAALSSSDLIHWSPVGVGFVKQSVRRGVLPALLSRILSARQAINSNMKRITDPQLKKSAHSRQLGLKLIANVTYGYTAANFSGRMPCVEVGDSVVAKSRETLERAIQLVNDGDWNAKVLESYRLRV